MRTVEAEELLVVARKELREIRGDLPIEDLAVDTSFSSFGVDSADLAELVARLEDTTGTLIGDDELVDVRCVADLAGVVTRLQQRRR
jgi:acyl carrier protein